MWTWSLNWGEITKSIVIGTCPMEPDDLGRIRVGAKVSALLSLQHDHCHEYWGIDYQDMCFSASAQKLTMRRCPIRDFDIPDMRRRLPDAIALLSELQEEGHRTYVHCTAGLGRAPLTVLGYLSMIEGFDPEDAIRLILRGRTEAVPAWEAFHGCRADLAVEFHDAIQERAHQLYESGSNLNPEADWRQAERQILRSAIMNRKAS